MGGRVSRPPSRLSSDCAIAGRSPLRLTSAKSDESFPNLLRRGRRQEPAPSQAGAAATLLRFAPLRPVRPPRPALSGKVGKSRPLRPRQSAPPAGVGSSPGPRAGDGDPRGRRARVRLPPRASTPTAPAPWENPAPPRRLGLSGVSPPRRCARGCPRSCGARAGRRPGRRPGGRRARPGPAGRRAGAAGGG